MTVTPPTVTGDATVAVKVSPGWLIFEPTACRRVTEICDPVGITSGGGGAGAGAGAAAAAGAGAAAVSGGAAAGAALGAGAVLGAGVAGAGVLDGAGAGAAALWSAGVDAGAGFSLVACWLCFLQPPASSRPARARGRSDRETRLIFITGPMMPHPDATSNTHFPLKSCP